MTEQNHKSAEEVLQFLRSITNRTETSNNKEQPKKQQSPARKQPSKIKQPTVKYLQSRQRKRRVDQNTVLKRILDGLQPTMIQFYNNEQQPYETTEKSSSTRLKIYLKQNQRILKTFIREEQKRKMQMTQMLNEYEETLEKQYFFTIKDSFRDEIELVISKNRVSKENYNTLEYNEVLISLADGEMKIYKDKQGIRLFKTIRLFEIENVEYNDQPYIFMIISFVKDKSKPLEYLYMRFSSQQSQQKWDRILYINYRLKDMKHKEMLFLADYKEQQIEVRKVQADTKPYSVDIKNLIQYFADTEINFDDVPQPRIMIEDQLTPRSQKGVPLAPLMFSSRHTPSQPESNRQIDSQKDFDITPRVDMSFMKSRIQPPPIMEAASDVPEHSEVLRAEIRRMKSETEFNPSYTERVEDKHEINHTLPSKLEVLENTLQSGLTFEKENFFKNSKKRLTIHKNSFDYVDLEKAEKGTIKESDRKAVNIAEISKVVTHDDGRLEVHYGKEDKKIIMKGDVDLFKQWLKLKIMQ